MTDLAVTYATDARIKRDPRALGLAAGRNNAGNEALLCAMAEASLTCLLDDDQREDVRTDSYEYLIGFCQGWREIMMVTPFTFLTRQQTARVLSLPARVRREWMQEYNRGCYAWKERGGNVEGNQPVLPGIP